MATGRKLASIALVLFLLFLVGAAINVVMHLGEAREAVSRETPSILWPFTATPTPGPWQDPSSWQGSLGYIPTAAATRTPTPSPAPGTGELLGAEAVVYMRAIRMGASEAGATAFIEALRRTKVSTADMERVDDLTFQWLGSLAPDLQNSLLTAVADRKKYQNVSIAQSLTEARAAFEISALKGVRAAYPEMQSMDDKTLLQLLGSKYDWYNP